MILTSNRPRTTTGKAGGFLSVIDTRRTTCLSKDTGSSKIMAQLALDVLCVKEQHDTNIG